MSDPIVRPKCSACGAELMFAKTEAGKWMPLDYGMNPSGIMAVARVGRTWVGARIITDTEPLRRGETQVQPHWKSCASRMRAAEKRAAERAAKQGQAAAPAVDDEATLF